MFSDTWRFDLKLNRVRDLVSDAQAARNPSQLPVRHRHRRLRRLHPPNQPLLDNIRNFIEDTLDVLNGLLVTSDGHAVKVDQLLKQYEKFVGAVPTSLMGQAKDANQQP